MLASLRRNSFAPFAGFPTVLNQSSFPPSQFGFPSMPVAPLCKDRDNLWPAFSGMHCRFLSFPPLGVFTVMETSRSSFERLLPTFSERRWFFYFDPHCSCQFSLSFFVPSRQGMSTSKAVLAPTPLSPRHPLVPMPNFSSSSVFFLLSFKSRKILDTAMTVSLPSFLGFPSIAPRVVIKHVPLFSLSPVEIAFFF